MTGSSASILPGRSTTARTDCGGNGIHRRLAALSSRVSPSDDHECQRSTITSVSVRSSACSPSDSQHAQRLTLSVLSVRSSACSAFGPQRAQGPAVTTAGSFRAPLWGKGYGAGLALLLSSTSSAISRWPCRWGACRMSGLRISRASRA